MTAESAFPDLGVEVGRDQKRRGKGLERVLVVEQPQAQLFEVVRALRAAGGLAGGLHGGQQQGDQNANKGDHHQQLDQRERTAAASTVQRLYLALPPRADACAPKSTRKSPSPRSRPHRKTLFRPVQAAPLAFILCKTVSGVKTFAMGNRKKNPWMIGGIGKL